MANHQKLLDWIENELITQNLHLGDQLPDDRELARKVGVSQNHMREILKSCEEIGVLRLFEGRRKSILSELVREPAVIAGPAMGLYLASSTHPQRDLVQTCLLLETHAVSTVPVDRSALSELDRLLTQMADPQITPADFHELEADFHIQLGRLSGNTLISALLASMRQAMVDARLDLMAKVPLWSSTAARLRMEHRAIVDAVRSGDPGLARTLVAANINERFTEAKIDVNRERQIDAPEEPSVIAPVDIEDRDLVPDTWEGTISPDLFDALQNIQPKAGSAPAPADTENTVEDADGGDEPQPVSQEDVWQAVRPEPVQSTVLRAAPTQGGRKRRGTVSSVHGGVIKPAAQKDAPDLEKYEAELRAEKERLAAEKAEAERRAEEERLAAEKAEQDRLEAERLEAERRAEEERLAAEKAEAERLEAERLDAKLRAEEERLAALDAALDAAREQEARELEEKLKAEEERLAALAQQEADLAQAETTAEADSDSDSAEAVEPESEPEVQQHAPGCAEEQVDTRVDTGEEAQAEPVEESAGEVVETAETEVKPARHGRRRFDIAGYFGFRQPARATQKAEERVSSEPDPQTSGLPLPAGYEPAEGEPVVPVYVDETAEQAIEQGNRVEVEASPAETVPSETVTEEPVTDAVKGDGVDGQGESEKPVISKAQRRSNSGKKKKGKKKRR